MQTPPSDACKLRPEELLRRRREKLRRKLEIRAAQIKRYLVKRKHPEHSLQPLIKILQQCQQEQEAGEKRQSNVLPNNHCMIQRPSCTFNTALPEMQHVQRQGQQADHIQPISFQNKRRPLKCLPKKLNLCQQATPNPCWMTQPTLDPPIDPLLALRKALVRMKQKPVPDILPECQMRLPESPNRPVPCPVSNLLQWQKGQQPRPWQRLLDNAERPGLLKLQQWQQQCQASQMQEPSDTPNRTLQEINNLLEWQQEQKDICKSYMQECRDYPKRAIQKIQKVPRQQGQQVGQIKKSPVVQKALQRQPVQKDVRPKDYWRQKIASNRESRQWQPNQTQQQKKQEQPKQETSVAQPNRYWMIQESPDTPLVSKAKRSVRWKSNSRLLIGSRTTLS